VIGVFETLVTTVPVMSDFVIHGQTFCPMEDRAIHKSDQRAAAPCPHCGVPLPAANETQMVELENGEVVGVRLSAPLKWWQQPMKLVLVVALLLLIFLILGSLDLF